MNNEYILNQNMWRWAQKLGSPAQINHWPHGSYLRMVYDNRTSSTNQDKIPQRDLLFITIVRGGLVSTSISDGLHTFSVSLLQTLVDISMGLKLFGWKQLQDHLNSSRWLFFFPLE